VERERWRYDQRHARDARETPPARIPTEIVDL
jgi:hypothetical protein